MPVPKIKVDPLNFVVPGTIKGYVRETYQELRDKALGNGPESKIAYDSFSLLVSLLEGHK